MAIETSFGDVADLYRAFRPPYPAEVHRRVIASVRPPRRLAYDLGAGTGLATLPLCAAFERVVALEPDPAMAQRLRGLDERVTVVAARAEDLPAEPASADLVQLANAFHWTDGPRVVARAAGALAEGGVLAAFRYRIPRAIGAADRVIEEELATSWAPFVHERLRDDGYTRRTVAEAEGFGRALVEEVPHVVALSPAALVGLCRTTSYGAAFVASLDDPAGYLAELERRLASASLGAPIAVDLSLELVIARRAGAVTAARRPRPPS